MAGLNTLYNIAGLPSGTLRPFSALIDVHFRTNALNLKAIQLLYNYRNVLFQDYHTERYEPTVDTSQDWLVDYGYEEAGWTVLGFTRALDTCDTAGDFKITVRHSITLI